jgi:hypothetical protein
MLRTHGIASVYVFSYISPVENGDIGIDGGPLSVPKSNISTFRQKLDFRRVRAPERSPTEDYVGGVREERPQYVTERSLAARILCEQKRISLERDIACGRAAPEAPDILNENYSLKHCPLHRVRNTVHSLAKLGNSTFHIPREAVSYHVPGEVVSADEAAFVFSRLESASVAPSWVDGIFALDCRNAGY